MVDLMINTLYIKVKKVRNYCSNNKYLEKIKSYLKNMIDNIKK